MSRNRTLRVLRLCGFHHNQSKLCFPDRRRRTGGSFAFVLFFEPLHRAGLPYGLDGLRFAAQFGLLCEPAVVVKDALARERLLEPVEELGGGIDLVVMLAVGEDGHLVEVFGEAGGRSAGTPPLSKRTSGTRFGISDRPGTSLFRAPSNPHRARRHGG